jgi:hypothetical protein
MTDEFANPWPKEPQCQNGGSATAQVNSTRTKKLASATGKNQR